MKKKLLLIIFIIANIVCYSQNGIYRSKIYESYRENKSTDYEIDYDADEKLLIYIKKVETQFYEGVIFWEAYDEDFCFYYEIKLTSLIGSNYESNKQRYVETYYANFDLYGKTMRKLKVFIIKDFTNNTVTCGLYDLNTKVYEWFVNMRRI